MYTTRFTRCHPVPVVNVWRWGREAYYHGWRRRVRYIGRQLLRGGGLVLLCPVCAPIVFAQKNCFMVCSCAKQKARNVALLYSYEYWKYHAIVSCRDNNNGKCKSPGWRWTRLYGGRSRFLPATSSELHVQYAIDLATRYTHACATHTIRICSGVRRKILKPLSSSLRRKSEETRNLPPKKII